MTSSKHLDHEWLPAFIGGFRSGSTLLVNLLGFHPRLTPWFETKEFCESLRWLRVLENPGARAGEESLIQPRAPAGFSLDAVAARMRWHISHNDRRLKKQVADGKRSHERYPFGGDHILYSLSEAGRALNHWLALLGDDCSPPSVARATGEMITALGGRQAALAGRNYWINKTPEIPRFGRELRSCLGDCRIVLMVRNGWDVVDSALALQWGQVEELAWWWRGLIEQSRDAAKPGLYLEVRYEELVSRPVETLDRVLEFIGIRPVGGQVYRNYLSSGGAPLALRSRRDGGRSGLRARFERVAGRLMAELGYD